MTCVADLSAQCLLFIVVVNFGTSMQMPRDTFLKTMSPYIVVVVVC